ncbi:major capsid protein [Acidovorax sp. SUPP2825]|uniref:major capsid protein n=1 Tax=Acidovorax sp. SUPP2825 TaxID=2920879 RepID=UPI0023DE4317|nr:major capsid protein [Acidovorax sp. SUPP2825]GKS96151.1 major capsid protein [Acidovorax sp. SUPP2825]
MKTPIRLSLENAVKRRFPKLARVASLPTVVVGIATLAATSSAHAAITLPDVAEIITAVLAVAAICSSIGIAVLSVVVTVRLFGWVKLALR